MPNRPKQQTEEPLERKLWKAADKLRKNIDAAEYKHIDLGLIFLKYISAAFEELYAKLRICSGGSELTEEQKGGQFKRPLSIRWNFNMLVPHVGFYTHVIECR